MERTKRRKHRENHMNRKGLVNVMSTILAMQ